MKLSEVGYSVGLVGKFKLDTKLTVTINEAILYEVTKVSSIKSLLVDNIDVEKLLYVDQGLSSSDYDTDLLNKVSIVELTSPSGEIITVPERTITNSPESSGVRFVNKTILVNIGYIEDSFNLDFVMDDVTAVVKEGLGLPVSTTLESVSGNFVSTVEEFDLWEAARRGNILTTKSCITRERECTIANQELQLTVESLQAQLELCENQ